MYQPHPYACPVVFLDGHLHSFQVSMITNGAPELCLSRSLWAQYFSRMDPSYWNCWIEDDAHFNLKRSARLPSKNIAPVCASAKTDEAFSPHCCQHWGLSVILIFSHQTGRCSISLLFSLHFSNYYWHRGSFYMFNGHLDFFCGLFVPVLCPFST